MITIINYGMGNLGSVQNMLKYIGVPSMITSDIQKIKSAEKLLLPGVGAFGMAMKLLKENNFVEILNEKVHIKKTPILGICLGMQLLTNYSEEGNSEGLGWIEGSTKKLKSSSLNLKVPHMGWNYVLPQSENKLMDGLNSQSRFYFVHSYYVSCKNIEDIVCTTNYGISFNSVINRDNVFGAQFHPEKSHKYGMKLLSNFSKI